MLCQFDDEVEDESDVTLPGLLGVEIVNCRIRKEGQQTVNCFQFT